jgi:hypothetical protein
MNSKCIKNLTKWYEQLNKKKWFECLIGGSDLHHKIKVWLTEIGPHPQDRESISELTTWSRKNTNKKKRNKKWARFQIFYIKY